MTCSAVPARILNTGDGLVIMGFDDNGRDNFVGQVTDPQPVSIDADGYLGITPNKNRQAGYG